jgi:hypothetical protein
MQKGGPRYSAPDKPIPKTKALSGAVLYVEVDIAR